MNKPISFHDVETLSAYLDNQLTGSEKARIELRLKNEPALSDALTELSQSRSILRKLPARRAPRNFTLTPKMAGIKPPVPRAIPIFRMASAFAAVLFLFAFLTNISVPALAAIRAAAPPVAFGMGGGGGGGPSDTENPAASEAAPAAPLAAAPMTTATPGIASAELAPTPTPETPPTAQAEIMPKAGGEAPKQQVPLQLPIPAWLQLGLLGLAVVTGGVAYILTARSDSKWFKARALSRRLDTNQIILIILAVLLALVLIGPVAQERHKSARVDLSTTKAGFRFIFSRPIIFSTMLLDFVATFFASANTMMPIVARDILKVGEVGYGFLSSAQPVGSVIAALIVSQVHTIRKQGPIFLGSVIVFGLATVLFGVSTGFLLAMLSLMLMGAADAVSTIIRNTIRQLQTPDHMRGRMTAVNQIFFQGGPQLGEVEAGIVAQLFGVPFCLISGGIGCIVGTVLIVLKWPQLRVYDREEPLPVPVVSP